MTEPTQQQKEWAREILNALIRTEVRRSCSVERDVSVIAAKLAELMPTPEGLGEAVRKGLVNMIADFREAPAGLIVDFAAEDPEELVDIAYPHIRAAVQPFCRKWGHGPDGVDRLIAFLISEFPQEPTTDDGPCDVAIRLMQTQQKRIEKGRDCNKLYTEILDIVNVPSHYTAYTAALKTAKDCGQAMIERDEAIRFVSGLLELHWGYQGVENKKPPVKQAMAFLARPGIKAIIDEQGGGE